MSKRREKRDPKLEALLETEMKLSLQFDKWYSRLKYALNRVDKIRKQRKRICRAIAEHTRPAEERTQP